MIHIFLETYVLDGVVNLVMEDRKKNSPPFQTVCQGVFDPATYSVVIKGQSVPPLIPGDCIPFARLATKTFLSGIWSDPSASAFQQLSEHGQRCC